MVKYGGNTEMNEKAVTCLTVAVVNLNGRRHQYGGIHRLATCRQQSHLTGSLFHCPTPNCSRRTNVQPDNRGGAWMTLVARSDNRERCDANVSANN